MKFLVLIAFVITFPYVKAQDLTKQRIWKISSKKRAVFLDKGVFYSELKTSAQQLDGIRNSYVPSRGYERIVFDFSTAKPPRVYGHISDKENKVFMDFSKTTLNKAIENVKNVKYVKNVDFFNLDKDNLSVELSFRSNVSFDIFYLENPGRIVIDVKK